MCGPGAQGPFAYRFEVQKDWVGKTSPPKSFDHDPWPVASCTRLAGDQFIERFENNQSMTPRAIKPATPFFPRSLINATMFPTTLPRNGILRAGEQRQDDAESQQHQRNFRQRTDPAFQGIQPIHERFSPNSDFSERDLLNLVICDSKNTIFCGALR